MPDDEAGTGRFICPDSVSMESAKCSSRHLADSVSHNMPTRNLPDSKTDLQQIRLDRFCGNRPCQIPKQIPADSVPQILWRWNLPE
jgi:hypothetical protein